MSRILRINRCTQCPFFDYLSMDSLNFGVCKYESPSQFIPTYKTIILDSCKLEKAGIKDD